MKKHVIHITCACFLTLTTSSVRASLIIDIYESGGNVNASYSGTLDTSATQGFLSVSLNPYQTISPATGSILFTADPADAYSVDMSWRIFGDGPRATWDFTSGDALKLYSGPAIGVPVGYVSGTNISGSASIFNSTLNLLGITTGSYVTTLTNGSNVDTVTVNVGPGGDGELAVPIPAATWLFGSGLMGLVAFARRRT